MTSSAAHTAGPWKVERGTVHHTGELVITAQHAGMTSNSPLAHVSTILGEEEAMPDARLIAAAPDLLAEHENIAVGGNHLATALVNKLGADFADRWPPDMDPQEALRTICATPWYDVWICWAAIMRARAAIAKASGGA